jgi:hypothetical protein
MGISCGDLHSFASPTLLIFASPEVSDQQIREFLTKESAYPPGTKGFADTQRGGEVNSTSLFTTV